MIRSLVKDFGTKDVAKGGGRGPVPHSQDVARAMRYQVLRAANPGWTKRRCAVAAGYSPTTSTYAIEQGHEGQLAAMQVSQYRDMLRQCPDASLGVMVAQLAAIATGTQTQYKPVLGKDGEATIKRVTEYAAAPKDRVAAIKQASAMLGYDAPQQVEQTVRGLLVELTGYASGDLAAIRAALTEASPLCA